MGEPTPTAEMELVVDRVIQRNGCLEHPESKLTAVLQGVQAEAGYLPRGVLEEVSSVSTAS